MKTLIGGIQKFSTEDGPGIRTSVFVKGCPLRCAWCHNPELILPEQQLMQSGNRCIGCGACQEACPRQAISPGPDGAMTIDRSRCDNCLACTQVCYPCGLRAAATPMTVEEVMAEVVKDRGYYEKTGGGVTLSGGEILTHPDFTRAMLDACQKEGISVALDTCGYVPWSVMEPLCAHPACQVVLYDLKAMDDGVHTRYTGVSNHLILENLTHLAADPALKGKVLLRFPLLSGVNDSDGEAEAAGRFLEKLGLARATLIPYHQLGLAKARGVGQEEEAFSPPDSGRLHRFADILNTHGVTADILGEQ